MTTWKEASEDLKARTESNFKVHPRRYFEAFEEDTQDYQDYTDQYEQAWSEFMDLCAEETQIDIDVSHQLNTLSFKLTNAFPILQGLLNTQPLFSINSTTGYRLNDFNDWLDDTEIKDLQAGFSVWALGELSDAITRGIQSLVSLNLVQVTKAENETAFWEEITKLYSVIGSFLSRVAEKALRTKFEENPEEELEPAEEIPEDLNDLVSSIDLPEGSEAPEEADRPFEESQKLKEAYWDISKAIYKAFEKLMKLEGVKRYCVSTERIEPDWAGSGLSFDVLWDSDEVPEQEVKDWLKAKFPYIKFSNSWDKTFEHVIGINVPESVWSK